MASLTLSGDLFRKKFFDEHPQDRVGRHRQDHSTDPAYSSSGKNDEKNFDRVCFHRTGIDQWLKKERIGKVHDRKYNTYLYYCRKHCRILIGRKPDQQCKRSADKRAYIRYYIHKSGKERYQLGMFYSCYGQPNRKQCCHQQNFYQYADEIAFQQTFCFCENMVQFVGII